MSREIKRKKGEEERGASLLQCRLKKKTLQKGSSMFPFLYKTISLSKPPPAPAVDGEKLSYKAIQTVDLVRREHRKERRY